MVDAAALGRQHVAVLLAVGGGTEQVDIRLKLFLTCISTRSVFPPVLNQDKAPARTKEKTSQNLRGRTMLDGDCRQPTGAEPCSAVACGRLSPTQGRKYDVYGWTLPVYVHLVGRGRGGTSGCVTSFLNWAGWQQQKFSPAYCGWRRSVWRIRRKATNLCQHRGQLPITVL